MSNITRILFHILSSPLCKNKDILVLFCFVALLLLLCQNAPCLLPCLHTSIFGKDQNVTKVFQAPKIKSRSVASASKLLYIRTCARFLLTAFETCVKRYTDREAGNSNRTAEQSKTEYLFWSRTAMKNVVFEFRAGFVNVHDLLGNYIDKWLSYHSLRLLSSEWTDADID